MSKKGSIVAGERVSYRRGAEKRKKGSALPPKQYGIVEKLDDKTKGLLHIKFDNGEKMQLMKSNGALVLDPYLESIANGDSSRRGLNGGVPPGKAV